MRPTRTQVLGMALGLYCTFWLQKLHLPRDPLYSRNWRRWPKWWTGFTAGVNLAQGLGLVPLGTALIYLQDLLCTEDYRSEHPERKTMKHVANLYYISYMLCMMQTVLRCPLLWWWWSMKNKKQGSPSFCASSPASFFLLCLGNGKNLWWAEAPNWGLFSHHFAFSLF